MVRKARIKALNEHEIDCACVIHGTTYPWIYVDNLYSMLCRHINRPIRLHVFTEQDRPVPEPYIKHALKEWPGIAGPKKSWWYKMQMFDPAQFQGRLLYLDLDVVILGHIDWMLELDDRYFWTIRDFRYHFRGAWDGINSSCMIWHTERFHYVWQDFCSNDINSTVRRFAGDQDYLNRVLRDKELRFLPQDRVRSWRWEVKDGGMDFKTRLYKRPDAGSVIPPGTDIMIFHGQPKPHEIQDPAVRAHWC